MADTSRTLARLAQAVADAGVPNQGVSLAPLRIDYPSTATPAQITAGAAVLAAFNPDDTVAQAAFELVDARNLAAAHMTVMERAILLTILDQVNVIRSRLPIPLGAITPAQMMNAFVAKANSGAAD